jgi:hypothetical protein
MVVEMTYHATQDAGNGPLKQLFGVAVDTHSTGPWLLAAGLLAAAAAGWRLARPGLVQAWDAAGGVIAERIRRGA